MATGARGQMTGLGLGLGLSSGAGLAAQACDTPANGLWFSGGQKGTMVAGAWTYADLTLEFHAYITRNAVDDAGILSAAVTTDDAAEGMFLGKDGATNHLSLEFDNEAYAPGAGDFWVDDEWHHYAITYNGTTGELIAYRDGAAQHTTTLSAGLGVGALAVLQVGARQSSAQSATDTPWTGGMLGFRVWSIARLQASISEDRYRTCMQKHGLVSGMDGELNGDTWFDYVDSNDITLAYYPELPAWIGNQGTLQNIGRLPFYGHMINDGGYIDLPAVGLSGNTDHTVRCVFQYIGGTGQLVGIGSVVSGKSHQMQVVDSTTVRISHGSGPTTEDLTVPEMGINTWHYLASAHDSTGGQEWVVFDGVEIDNHAIIPTNLDDVGGFVGIGLDLASLQYDGVIAVVGIHDEAVPTATLIANANNWAWQDSGTIALWQALPGGSTDVLDETSNEFDAVASTGVTQVPVWQGPYTDLEDFTPAQLWEYTFSFDGGDDASSSALGISGNASLTVGFWFTYAAPNDWLFGIGDLGGSGNNFITLRTLDATTLQFRLRGVLEAIAVPSMTIGSWHYAAVICDHTGPTYDIILDGTVYASAFTLVPDWVGTDPVYLGAVINTTVTPTFEGDMTAFQVYDAAVPTSTLITNRFSPRYTNSDQIVNYPMQDGAGDIITDVSGNLKHGTRGAGAAAPTWEERYYSINGAGPQFWRSY